MGCILNNYSPSPSVANCEISGVYKFQSCASGYLQNLESHKSFFISTGFAYISSLLSPNEKPTFSTAGLPVLYNQDDNIELILDKY